jgi:hypothetical protein
VDTRCERASVLAFEDVTAVVVEDEEALDEDKRGGKLEGEEEPVHVGRLPDAAVVPVEARGRVVTEALRLLKNPSEACSPPLIDRPRVSGRPEIGGFRLSDQRS